MNAKIKLSKVGSGIATVVLTSLTLIYVARGDTPGCGQKPGVAICGTDYNFCNTPPPNSLGCGSSVYSPCQQNCIGGSSSDLCESGTIQGTLTTYSGTCGSSGCNLPSSGTVTHPFYNVITTSGICVGG